MLRSDLRTRIIDEILRRRLLRINNLMRFMFFQLRQQFSAQNFIDDATSEIASGHQNPFYGTSRCPQKPSSLSRTPEKIWKISKPKWYFRKTFIRNKYPTSFSNPCFTKPRKWIWLLELPSDNETHASLRAWGGILRLRKKTKDPNAGRAYPECAEKRCPEQDFGSSHSNTLTFTCFSWVSVTY